MIEYAKRVGLVICVAFFALTAAAEASGPAAELDRTEIDFGTHNRLTFGIYGDSVKISSIGDEPVTVQTVEVTQPEGGPFEAGLYPDSDCAKPILPGGSCGLGIRFRFDSSLPGRWNGTLRIKTDASNEPLEVQLSGLIVTTTLKLRLTPRNFGKAPLGIASGGPTRVFKITSTGSVPFRPEIDLYGSSFRIVGKACDRAIKPGASCTLVIRFRPLGKSKGIRKGRLLVGEGRYPDSVKLSGWATARQPAKLKRKGNVQALPSGR